MVLIDELFPGLSNREARVIPDFPDRFSPWKILGSGDSGIVEQILNLDAGGGDIFIHPSSKISDFVQIEGPSYIGKNVEIRQGAMIRKGSWICEGAIVGHCSEVKNSILLPGAKAPHFNYVGDSILGFDSNIGAGAKISNVRNDGRSVLVTMKDGTRIDSGLRKLGALVGDNSHLGCNVVTNPGAIIEPGSMIQPNDTVSGWFGLSPQNP